MIQLAHQFHEYRLNYINHLQPILFEIFSNILPGVDLKLRYYKGWPMDTDLSEALENGLMRDQQLGYTQYGPHRADLQLYIGKAPIGDMLSQGQQKLVAYALHLAQGLLLQKLTEQKPIYLIDDLPSELDPEKRRLISSLLKQLQAQVFITGITADELNGMLPDHSAQMFHVEQGQIQLFN